jgi:hypothetical protein
MSTAESWRLTPREYQARERVFESYLHRWARELATIANAPHFHRKDKKPYEPVDFVPTAAALAERQEKQKRERRDKQDLMFLQLHTQRKLTEEMVPEWARGPYMGNAPKLQGLPVLHGR